jgi:aspartate racemase
MSRKIKPAEGTGNIREKIIGILGGMGPEATADFFSKVIALTPARKDQEHLRIIIDNNPKIPDRTEAIINKGESSAPLLIKTARNLEKAGVDFIVIPCNTAHYYYEDLVKEISVPVIHMIREVVKAVQSSLPRCQRVGLLATSGAAASKLYQKEFQKAGIDVIAPDPENQARVMDAINKIKSGRKKEQARETLLTIGNGLIAGGKAQAVVLGCTDIPLVIKKGDFSVPVFDSNWVLAEATVKFAREFGEDNKIK